jgi:hypothetical protein
MKTKPVASKVKPTRKPAAGNCEPTSTPDPRFRQDAETRGEAVELTPDGKLPLGATHAIIKKGDGTTTIKRGRFNLTN